MSNFCPRGDLFSGLLIGAHFATGSGEVETDFCVAGGVGLLKEHSIDHLSMVRGKVLVKVGPLHFDFKSHKRIDPSS